MTHLYLDACSLINLYATRHLVDIAAELGLVFHVTPWVSQKEALQVYERTGDKRGGKKPIDLSEAVASGSVVLEAGLVAESELSLLIEFSQRVDQGEAETMAAVVSRGGGFVSDDGAAMKLLSRKAPHVAIYTSIGIVKDWSESVGMDNAELKEVLLDLRVGGNFLPGKREPHLKWWKTVLEQPE